MQIIGILLLLLAGGAGYVAGAALVSGAGLLVAGFKADATEKRIGPKSD